MKRDDAFLAAVHDDLDQLAYLHGRGLLVPFLGAGMSASASKTWPDFVAALEARADAIQGDCVGHVREKPSKKAASEELVRRANRAVRRLRRVPDLNFTEEIRRAVENDDRIPSQTALLAELEWDLVLTTNYDDNFYRAFTRADTNASPTRPLVVLGRSMADCQAVLGALEAPREPVLWALQGFLRSRAVDDPMLERLEHELVVGHSEYRRAAHTALHFRRAFAEVFRRRTLLFLGSSLTDSYLIDLFGEVVEMFGPVPRPHYALVPASSNIDEDFLRSRLHIRALRYNTEKGHQPVEDFLSALQDRIRAQGQSIAAWRYRCVHAAGKGKNSTKPPPSTEVDLVLGSIGTAPFDVEREALCISTGIVRGRYYVGDDMRSALRGELNLEIDSGSRADGFERLWLLKSSREDVRLVAGCPWFSDDQRDIRLVAAAATEAFEWAEREGVQRLRMTLLGAGKQRHFSPTVSLAQILGAWRNWSRGAPRRLQLALYVFDKDAARALKSGLFDPAEILSSDLWRFWVEVRNHVRVRGGDVEREPFMAPTTYRVSDVARDLDICLDERWVVSVHPPPMLEPTAIDGDESLAEIGLSPGGTIRFEQVNANSREALTS